MNSRHLRHLAVITLLCVLPRLGAAVYQFTFTQGGYEFGAHVEGTLFLRDDNNDGFVTSGPGYMSTESISGFMRLVGHPLYPALGVSLYGGWFDLNTLTFQVYGDSPLPQESLLLDGFIATSRGGFSNLRDYGTIYSNEAVVLRRVPESGQTIAMMVAALFLIVAGRRFHGITSVSMVR